MSGRNRYRERVIDALNGHAPNIDPAVKRALLAIADEAETQRVESEKRDDAAQDLARSAVDALAAVKTRVTTIAIGIAAPVISAAIVAAIRLT